MDAVVMGMKLVMKMNCLVMTKGKGRYPLQPPYFLGGVTLHIHIS